jgi:hypothetical protein
MATKQTYLSIKLPPDTQLKCHLQKILAAVAFSPKLLILQLGLSPP